MEAKTWSGASGRPSASAGLLLEGGDGRARPRLQDAEAGRLLHRHPDGADGHARPGGDVLLDHLAGVHPVDVVGAEDADVVGTVVADEVEVLEDGVGRAREPPGPPPHLGRHRGDVGVEQRRQAPRAADVEVEAVGLVLGQHDDAQVAAVGQVGQGEVDQPVVAAEGHRRLGPVGGERVQPLALAAGQHHRQHPGLSHARHRTRRFGRAPAERRAGIRSTARAPPAYERVSVARRWWVRGTPTAAMAIS